MVGILLSYWEGLFSGAMLVSGSVYHLENRWLATPKCIGLSWPRIQKATFWKLHWLYFHVTEFDPFLSMMLTSFQVRLIQRILDMTLINFLIQTFTDSNGKAEWMWHGYVLERDGVHLFVASTGNDGCDVFDGCRSGKGFHHCDYYVLALHEPRRRIFWEEESLMSVSFNSEHELNFFTSFFWVEKKTHPLLLLKDWRIHCQSFREFGE